MKLSAFQPEKVHEYRGSYETPDNTKHSRDGVVLKSRVAIPSISLFSGIIDRFQTCNVFSTEEPWECVSFRICGLDDFGHIARVTSRSGGRSLTGYRGHECDARHLARVLVVDLHKNISSIAMGLFCSQGRNTWSRLVFSAMQIADDNLDIASNQLKKSCERLRVLEIQGSDTNVYRFFADKALVPVRLVYSGYRSLMVSAAMQLEGIN